MKPGAERCWRSCTGFAGNWRNSARGTNLPSSRVFSGFWRKSPRRTAGRPAIRNRTRVDYDLQLLKRVLAHIEQNYSRRIYIRELAKMGHMADAQFCRFFKRWVRRTPTEYINSYRVKKAAELLRQSDRKLSDIAREVGFDHPSYFIRRFRAELRCTPAVYRRRHRRGLH